MTAEMKTNVVIDYKMKGINNEIFDGLITIKVAVSYKMKV